ncbi:MAG: homoserine O-acetyltransferase/O-succinyltransferase family protein [Stellaceae bacterium]
MAARAKAELVVALVNNMPNAAKRATKHQFASLMAAAAQAMSVRLRLVVIDQFQAKTAAAFRLLESVRPDGIIVTGDEPQGAAIANEPLVPALARLVDWAAGNTLAAAWSCLAAHAAVFALDGVERRQLRHKLSGMFECTASSDHPLLAGLTHSWLTPHSRHNSIDEAKLWSKGYTVLSVGPQVGVDMFLKPVRGCLFLFLQGHPEYEPDSLFKEYRRDVKRFLAGEWPDHPAVPVRYFGRRADAKLAALRRDVRELPPNAVLAGIDAAFAAGPAHLRNPAATRLYANWLALVAEGKAQHAVPSWRDTAQRGAA